ncbi:lipid transfer-like protein VAS [Cinnamomum micranthum f. kanehirae]|uniref:Lipid transfer-like protein VAS n=1 Tax=Cinnamomum micranthum f. kanehirae TaxID=337451 RepID=A0A443PEU0_9MAGN|nr:lipid transfer-like protein VAS [Cinnamomum micranthum f. kanehirae]
MACSNGKGSGFGGGFVVMALVAALVLMGTNGVVGQQLPGCIGKLLPCTSYLNSTAPPESCCNPMKEAFEKEISCLCGLYNSRESFKSLGLNITQILELPKHCGINYNLNACDSLAPSPSPSSAATFGPAPGSSSGDAPPPGLAGSSNMARVGMAGLMTMLLLAASMIV